MAVANTLAYYNAATVMPVKGFIVQGLEVTHQSKVLNSKCYTQRVCIVEILRHLEVKVYKLQVKIYKLKAELKS